MASAIAAPPSPRLRGFVAWTLRHGRALWIVAAVLAIPAALRTAHLYRHLRSDLKELLPRQAPSVLALDELRARMPNLRFLGVIVDTGSESNLVAGERMVDDLAAAVRAYPPPLVRSVRTGNALEHRFLEDHAPLYMELSDLAAIRERIEVRRDWEVGRETGSSLDDGPAPPLDFSDVKAKYEQKIEGRSGKLEGERYSSRSAHLTMMLIEAGEISTGSAQRELFDRVRADVQRLGRSHRYAPGMRVGYTSDVAISVEEKRALLSDLSFSSVLVVVAVILVVVLYFRWWRSVLALVAPLLLATVYSFGLSSLPPFRVTELNANTAFLASIIVGNGINFGIILLARYAEERRRAVAVTEALATAVASARIGTLTAALAAGVSYASLVITEFRGFRQFGIIGGVGMVMSWLVAFLLMPPLTAWLDRETAMAPRPLTPPLMASLAALIRRFAMPITLLTALATVGAAWQLRGFGVHSLESDFSKLRRADTWTRGEGYWGRRMDVLLGQYVTPTVILADDAGQARSIAAAARAATARSPLAELVASVRSADDVLPPDEGEKIALVSDIRDDLTPKIRSLLSRDDRTELERLLGQPELRPLTVDDLPASFTAAMREKDGTFGRTVLVYPRPVHELWEGPPLAAFVAALRRLAATGTGAETPPARVAGSLPLSADILSTIGRDGPRASLAAFLGVVAVVVLLFRGSRTTVFVTGSLVVGVLWLFAATVLFGIKINFANFIAFPITFGIGVDYSVNIMNRYLQDGAKDPVAAVASTGGAVALCSLTTIIGYSSLLLAQNRALFLFGLLAVLGEISCLTTALIALPAALVVFDRRGAIRLSR